MAKKKINIILILVVLGLWGTVGYKALNKQFLNNEVVPEKQNYHANININQINKDTFKLEKTNRDPFLNKEFQNPIAIVSPYKLTKKTVLPVPLKVNKNLNWPALNYYGYIVSKEKNEELFLLKIDSKLRKLKLNIPLNGLVVKKKYKDSIEVFFNTETKMIRLK